MARPKKSTASRTSGDTSAESAAGAAGTSSSGRKSHEWDERRGRHVLVDHAQCSTCGRAKKFAFDVSGYFTVEGG